MIRDEIMMHEKLTTTSEQMVKIACPHCQALGETPSVVLQNSNWPIACHHCSQHYFAPVVSGPEKLVRQTKITCTNCKIKAAIDTNKYEAVIACAAELYCPDCHHPLPLAKASRQKQTPATEIETLPLKNSVAEAASTASSSLIQPVLPGWRSAALLVFAGFVLTALVMMAAQEELIDRTWLDKFLAGLPDRQEVSAAFSTLLR